MWRAQEIASADVWRALPKTLWPTSAGGTPERASAVLAATATPRPGEVHGRPRGHDAEADQSLHRPRDDRIPDDRRRGGDEQRGCDGIAGDAKRARCVRAAPA